MKILAKPNLVGRMIGWAMELSEFHIQYQPKGAIKSQALANFATEISPQRIGEENTQWTLHVDDYSNSRSCGAGVVLEGPSDILLKPALKFEFKKSNNQAEYEAIIVGLNLTLNLEMKKLLCKSDS